MADITMPQLGETVTEGTITKWLKQVGDRVEADELLFEVSTDKVDSEVPSPVAGYVAEILVPEGETVDVGTKIATVTDQEPAEGGDASTAAPAADAETAARPAEGSTGKAEVATPASPVAEVAADAPAGDAQPADVQPAEEPSPAPVPSGDGRGDGRKAEPATAPEPPSRPAAGGDEGKVLSPVVRRLIAEHGLDAAQIEGTGAGGRITRGDVLALIDAGASSRGSAPAAAPPKPAPTGARPAPAAKAPAPAPGRSEAVAGGPPADDEVIPFSNIRRRTGEHMVRSKATSPHVLIVTEVDYEAVDRVRRTEREAFKVEEGFSLTYLPFVCRAVVDAIEDFPHVNASVGENALVVHRRLHLGIAVDLNFEGLIVPVVHDADGKRLRAIARDVSDLATRARSKKLTADDISGGTFTITNPGPFGTLITSAVINQPQVAILATDGVKKRPVAVELPDGSDAIVVHPVGNLALSFDHRAFDGAYAAAFLDRVKTILETRDWSEEL